MKLEQQVNTIAQDRRLVQLGIKQDISNFVWYKNKVVMPTTLEDDGENHVYFTAPAFTCAELGKLLPTGEFLTGYLIHGQYGCGYYPKKDSGKVNHSVFEATETSARAAMLIYLLENNLIDANDCNNRLNA